MTARYRPFVLLSSLAALIVASALVSGQTGVTNGEWPHWGGDLGSSKVLAARSDQPRQREEPADRVAVEDRELSGRGRRTTWRPRR